MIGQQNFGVIIDRVFRRIQALKVNLANAGDCVILAQRELQAQSKLNELNRA